MLSRAITRLGQTNTLSMMSKRTRYVLYQPGPPNHKLNNVELGAMGVVFLLGIMGPAFYISKNMQEYNGKAQARREAAAAADA